MSFVDLERENAALRAQLAQMKTQIEEHEQQSAEQAQRLAKALAEASEQARVLNATMNSITDGVMVCDMNGLCTHTNRGALEISGTSPVGAEREEWVASPGIFYPDGVTPFPPNDMPLLVGLRGERVDGVEMFIRNGARPDGIWISASASPIRSEDGTMLGAVTVFRDITEKKRHEQRERERQLIADKEKNDLLRRLQLAVHELSTPVLEVWDDVLVLPVIGVVDSERSAEMMERLLEAVERKQCRHVIIDITGVEVVDSATAQQLIKLVTAVEYLGARCVLTGTRRAVAHTLVSLGLELGPITMLRTLKHGLQECMRRMEAESMRGGAGAVLKAARAREALSSGG